MYQKLLYTILACLLAHASAQAQENDTSLALLSEEVAVLSRQNAELIAALKDRLARYESQQATVNSLAQRVAELENAQTIEAPESPAEPTLETQIASLETASLLELAEQDSLEHEPNISFGGWAGFVFADDDRDGTKPYFDAHPLYLYTKAEPAENWTFFGELEFEHLFKSSSSGTKGDLKIERLYLEHQLADSGKIRAGKFFIPFGYWYRLHWHFLTETLSRPISFNNAYVPRQQVGIEYLNTASLGDAHLSYYAWLGDGPDISGTNKRSESDFSLGAAIFAETHFGEHLAAGASLAVHQQKVNFETQRNYVLGGKLSSGPIDLRGEIYHHERELSDNLDTAYLSAQFNASDTFGFVYRYDFGDDLKSSKDPLSPDADTSSIGFIWRPQPYLLFKGEYRFNEFESATTEDFNNWNLFSAIKF
ncbi:hypothetical protein VDG1235_2132 [Verrucomicrobiia bacterium DG1235]|nr:hypothetical protein VDG1235_2132 [Verrucomicrobiae bacterium DG1235]